MLKGGDSSSKKKKKDTREAYNRTNYETII